MFKAPFAQPVVTREYRGAHPAADHADPQPLPGNMFQVYPQDRGQNYSVRLANKLAAHLQVETSASDREWGTR